MVINAFRAGIRTAYGCKRMILIILLTNLAFALTLTLPIYDALVESTGHSVEARRLLNYPDWNWLTDFAAAQSARFSGLSAVSLGIVLIYVIIHTYFAGGILSLLAEGRRFTARAFFAEAGRLFPRLFRLMLLSLAFYYALDRVFNGYAADWVTRLTENSRVENTAFYGNLARQGLYVALFFFVNMIFDYAKIDAVARDGTFMLGSLFAALGFVFRNLVNTLGLYYIMAGVQGLVLMVFSVLDGWITRQSTLGLALGIALSQILLFARVGFRVACFAGEMNLYSALSPARRPPAAAEGPVEISTTSPPIPEGLVQITLPPPTK